MKIRRLIIGSVLLFLISCAKEREYVGIDFETQDDRVTGKTVLTFKELYDLKHTELGKDTLVMGYVISSDEGGNFFKELYIQNKIVEDDERIEMNPKMGMKILLDVRNTNTRFSAGRKIAINLEGLKKSTSHGSLQIGKPEGFVTKAISEFDVTTHIYKLKERVEVVAQKTTLPNLSHKNLNTRVFIENVHFTEKWFGMPLAGLPLDEFDGERAFVFCNEKRRDTLILETSNFFRNAHWQIPQQKLTIEGVYHLNFHKKPVLSINTIKAIELLGEFEACPEITSSNLMLTEVADPDVGTEEKARYVEIYNPTTSSVSLDGWILKRYNKTSKNNVFELSLEGLEINAKEAIVIANPSKNKENEKTWFETYFLRIPEVTNFNLDGNGDDAYELIDFLGNVKDVYGEPNIDGTGLVWEYENGVATRKKDVLEPASFFNIDEWEVKQDIEKLKVNETSMYFSPGVR